MQKNNKSPIYFSLISILFLVVFFFFFSCTNKVNNTLKGWWTIDTIYYNKKWDVKTCLTVNVICFDENNCELPSTKYCNDERIYTVCSKGNWLVIKGDSTKLDLKITSKNKIFNGTHQLLFRRDDENRVLKLELYSDSLYLVCRKGMFDYSSEQNLVEFLEKATH